MTIVMRAHYCVLMLLALGACRRTSIPSKALYVDLGAHQSGITSELAAEFRHTWQGEAGAIVSEVRASCGCVDIDYSSDALAPGAIFLAVMHIDTAGKRGLIEESVDVLFSDGSSLSLVACARLAEWFRPDEAELQVLGNVYGEFSLAAGFYSEFDEELEAAWSSMDAANVRVDLERVAEDEAVQAVESTTWEAHCLETGQAIHCETRGDDIHLSRLPTDGADFRIRLSRRSTAVGLGDIHVFLVD